MVKREKVAKKKPHKFMNKNLIATILIVLAIVAYFTVTEKILDDAKAVKAVNDRYVAAINSAKKLIAVRDKVRLDYTNLSDNNRDRLAKMIPGSIDNIRLLIDMESIAKSRGLTLKDLKATANESKSDTTSASDDSGMLPEGAPQQLAEPVLDTVNISFGVTASYDTFQDLMRDLEANLRLMDVTSLSVKASDTNFYDFTVELKTYWLRQK